jgi:hypothetical protein
MRALMPICLIVLTIPVPCRSRVSWNETSLSVPRPLERRRVTSVARVSLNRFGFYSVLLWSLRVIREEPSALRDKFAGSKGEFFIGRFAVYTLLHLFGVFLLSHPWSISKSWKKCLTL